jgi:GTP-binding protein HflX
VTVSGEGTDALLGAVDDVLARDAAQVVVRVPCSEGEAIAWLHRVSFTTESEEAGDDLLLHVSLPKAEIDRFMKRWSKIAIVEQAGG